MALGDTYRETLDRHAALLRQAEPFRARPKAFTALLAEHAGIGCEDLETFEALHDRARQHLLFRTLVDEGFPGLFPGFAAWISNVISSLPDRGVSAS